MSDTEETPVADEEVPVADDTETPAADESEVAAEEGTEAPGGDEAEAPGADETETPVPEETDNSKMHRSESYRADKSGLAAECQQKVEANYDPEEAAKCLHWIRLLTGVEEIPEEVDQIDGSHDNFYELLFDGMLLCKLIDQLYPNKINWNDKTFQEPKIEAMRIMRQRERIALFNNLVQEFGVPNTSTFPTESLHELGALNLAQVCVCIRALGVQAQSNPDYTGPEGFWPKKNEKNIREFTEEQLRSGNAIISLQYGSNKGATQKGMNMGRHRPMFN